MNNIEHYVKTICVTKVEFIDLLNIINYYLNIKVWQKIIGFLINKLCFFKDPFIYATNIKSKSSILCEVESLFTFIQNIFSMATVNSSLMNSYSLSFV